MTDGFVSDCQQAKEALTRLAAEDVACLPLLSAPELEPLLHAARALTYRTAWREVGSGDQVVRQDFDICMAPPKPGPLWQLAARLEKFLGTMLAACRPALLDDPLNLNDLVVQRYPAGSFGITAHRDHVRYDGGLVGLVLLCGEGRFFACREHSGADVREIAWQPGNHLLMRASGFAGRTDRPFHYLCDITSERYSIGLRHDTQVNGEP